MRGPVIFLPPAQRSALQSLADAGVRARVRRPTLEALVRHDLATPEGALTDNGRRWLAESNDDRHETIRADTVQFLVAIGQDPTLVPSSEQVRHIDDERHVVPTPEGWQLTQRGKAVVSLVELHAGAPATAIGDWDVTGFTPWGAAVQVLARLERAGYAWRLIERSDLLTFDGRPWAFYGTQPWLELRLNAAPCPEPVAIEAVEQAMLNTADELRLILDDSGVTLDYEEARQADHTRVELSMAQWDDGNFHAHVSRVGDLIVGDGLELFRAGRGRDVRDLAPITTWRAARL